MNDVFALNLRHLDALSVIGRAGSMSSAAKTVNLSQPALTQAIGKVELVVGERLFERQPGGMVPTAAGRALIIRVERALRYLMQGVRLVRRSARLAPIAHIERRVTMAQLRALIAVEDTSSYALAATQTDLSQPAVHRAVRDLQELLGTALFVRVGRAVRPTDVASRFVRFARLMLSELRTGIDEVAPIDAGGGHIRVGTLPMARAVFLPELLGRFAAAYPAASVEVREAPYGELLHALRHGDIDLLIGGAWRDPSPASDVVQEELFYDELAIVGNATHPLRRKKRATVADLMRFPWIIPSHGVPMRTNWERMFLAQGVDPPTPRIECGSVLVTRGLMFKGDWLTLMSRDQFLFERTVGALAEIGSPGDVLRRRMAMTRRGDWRPTSLQAHFVEMAHKLAKEREQPGVSMSTGCIQL
jgi:LysR family transcriptional regulator, regulator for genes of the gallate degradation pathway